jgi:hypothetical protein
MHTAAEYRATIRAILPTVHPGASLDAAIYDAIQHLIHDDIQEVRRDGVALVDRFTRH